MEPELLSLLDKGFLSLPDEVLCIIYGFVDDEHLVGGLSQTCWRLHEVSKVGSLWTPMCEPIYQLMGMRRKSWKKIRDQRAFYYDQMRTRGEIYKLLDELESSTSKSPDPCDDSYCAYKYSLIRKICEYKEKAIPSLYPIYTSDPVESTLSLTRQFYAKSILAVIVKLRALEVLKNYRFAGNHLLEFVIAVRDLCSDSLSYELLQFLDSSTLDSISEKIGNILGVLPSKISEQNPKEIAEALSRLMCSTRHFEALRDVLMSRLHPRFRRTETAALYYTHFVLTASAALYTHFARHLGLKACTAVLKSWTCVVITDKSGNRFVVDVKQDWDGPTEEVPAVYEQDWVKPEEEVLELAEITTRQLNYAIKKADKRLARIICSIFADTATFLILPRVQLVMYGLRSLFRIESKKRSLILSKVFTEIPLHVLVLEKMPGNPSVEVEDILHKTLNAPGETIKSRRSLAKEVKFKIGQVCTIKTARRMKGVIVGWNQPLSPRGLTEVSYTWLSDNEVRTGVPESNLEAVSPLPEFSSLCTPDAVADYTKLGEYFMRFDEQSIEPNGYLRYIYPDD